MQQITCPQCGKQYRLRDEMAAKKAKCKCGQVIVVPELVQEPSSASDPMSDLFDEEVPGGGVSSPLDDVTAAADLTAGLPASAGPLGTIPKKKKTGRNPMLLAGIIGGAVVAVAILVLVISSIGGSGSSSGGSEGSSPQSPGYATPAEAFEAHKKARLDRDWRAHILIFTPESQQRMTAIAAVSLAYTARGRDSKSSDILAKHGIDRSLWREVSFPLRGTDAEKAMEREQRKEKLGAIIDDKVAFYAEAMTRLIAHSEEELEAFRKKSGRDIPNDREEERRRLATYKLGDVQIKGDTAEGKTSLELTIGKPIESSVHFRQINGRWYMYKPDFAERQEIRKKSESQK